jgi:endonuclease YncB( thermonuclease family)
MVVFAFLFLLQSTDWGVRTVGQPVQRNRTSAPQVVSGTGTNFMCSVASITDGDTLRCADGTRVRIAGIDAPETSPCATGRQCTAGDGTVSRRSLATMASGRLLTCHRVGTSYKRAVAFCSVGGVDLSCAQVRAGQAVPRYAAKEQVCR